MTCARAVIRNIKSIRETELKVKGRDVLLVELFQVSAAVPAKAILLYVLSAADLTFHFGLGSHYFRHLGSGSLSYYLEGDLVFLVPQQATTHGLKLLVRYRAFGGEA